MGPGLLFAPLRHQDAAQAVLRGGIPGLELKGNAVLRLGFVRAPASEQRRAQIDVCLLKLGPKTRGLQ